MFWKVVYKYSDDGEAGKGWSYYKTSGSNIEMLIKALPAWKLAYIVEIKAIQKEPKFDYTTL